MTPKVPKTEVGDVTIRTGRTFVGRIASAALPQGTRKASLKTYRIEVVVRPWEEGGYIAEAPALQGCWVVADTIEAALEDIQEVIAMSIESRLERGEPLPAGVRLLKNKEKQVKLVLAVSVR